MKLLIIGIDGLDPFFIEDFLEHLPTFQRLQQDCEWHLVHCDSANPNSLAGWASLYTGLFAKDHGFSNWELFSDIPAWSGLAETLRSKGLFWDHLNAAGYSVGLLNPTLVWPARMKDGWCVAGFPSPFYQFRYRGGTGVFDATQGLYSSPDVARLAPEEYVVDAEDYAQVPLTNEDRSAWYVPKIKQLVHLRTKFALNLFQELPVDIGFVCYTVLDRIKHAMVHFFPGKPGFTEALSPLEHANKEILEGYKLVDNAIAILLKQIQPEMLLVCADHGLNFSTKTPVPINIQGDKGIGDPFALGHTWVTIGFSKGPDIKAGQVGNTDLTWLFRKIITMLGISASRTSHAIEGSWDFTEEELKAIKKKLEGLGYL